jgi:ribonucleoside-diphosphate reductase alpha chain
MPLDALFYFHGDELPANVFLDKYAAPGETSPEQMHRRHAREFARIESSKFARPFSEDFIYELLKDFGHIVPQGGPMAGIGTGGYVSFSNCFVVDSPYDSYGGICNTDEQLVQISKRRGGVGLDLSPIRPAGMPTANSARSATGIVPFMHRFSNSIREVAQNGRRGALMMTLDVHHPQILDFIRAKESDRAKITGANLSTRLTDEFLTAVANDSEYEQRWPVNSKTPQMRRMVRAREVWNETIRCAWQSAEPGVLFWDRILRESPADCYAEQGFRTVSTNPCSELPLSVLDSCRLLLLNLFSFVRHPFTGRATFDLPKFKQYCRYAQRLMDDLVDLETEAIDRIIKKVESDPEPMHIRSRELDLWHRVRTACVNGRRTGTGTTALGDCLAAIGIRYGSEESIEFVDNVYREMKLSCYTESVAMAKELGAFPVCDPGQEADCPFLLRIRDEDPSLYADMQKHGRRNIALLTIAPAGSTSLLCGPRPYFGTTSGIEPLFTDVPYTRRRKISPSDKRTQVDFTDVNGDQWAHYKVHHSKIAMWMDVTGETDLALNPYHGCCAEDLDWKQRVKLQAAAQRHIDHGISSTLNLPADVTQEQVAEIYLTAWQAGCKGLTVYRKGCRDGVLVTDNPPEKLPKTVAPKRPARLPCDIHHLRVQSSPYVVVVGLFDGRPYEVFTFMNLDENGEPLIEKVTEGDVFKRNRTSYLLLQRGQDVSLLKNGAALSALEENDVQEALTRMVSTALRHGADLGFMVHQLEKVKHSSMYGFSQALNRALKKYLPDGTAVKGEKCQACGATGLTRQEGCIICRTCGWSKC